MTRGRAKAREHMRVMALGDKKVHEKEKFERKRKNSIPKQMSRIKEDSQETGIKEEKSIVNKDSNFKRHS